MSGSVLLITGWILLAVSTVMLLMYRLLLRYYDRQLVRFSRDSLNPLHSLLQHRMTFVDRWGVSMTIGIALYTLLFLLYLVYQSFERIAQALLRLLSLI